MPCKGGYRKDIENSKAYYEQESKWQESPQYRHWEWLVGQVYRSEQGFSGLSYANQLFYASRLLAGAVYNGGFHQYFHDSTADYYSFAVEGLQAIGAIESKELLQRAKQILFPDRPVPTSQKDRWIYITELGEEQQVQYLNVLDEKFWTDPDGFDERMDQFAQKHGLYRNF